MNDEFTRLSIFRTDISNAIAVSAAEQDIREDQIWALALSWLIQTGQATYGTERVVAALRGIADDLDSECYCQRCRQ